MLVQQYTNRGMGNKAIGNKGTNAAQLL